MLPEANSSFLRNNFLIRMLYTDVYWHLGLGLSVFTLLFYELLLRLSMTFSKETDDDDDYDDDDDDDDDDDAISAARTRFAVEHGGGLLSPGVKESNLWNAHIRLPIARQ